MTHLHSHLPLATLRAPHSLFCSQGQAWWLPPPGMSVHQGRGPALPSPGSTRIAFTFHAVFTPPGCPSPCRTSTGRGEGESNLRWNMLQQIHF